MGNHIAGVGSRGAEVLREAPFSPPPRRFPLLRINRQSGSLRLREKRVGRIPQDLGEVEMVDYEKGSAAWDIAQILTRHYAPFWSGQPCARVASLRSTIGVGMNAPARLMSALETACTCGSGDSESEQTSLKKEADAAPNSPAALAEESAP